MIVGDCKVPKGVILVTFSDIITIISTCLLVLEDHSAMIDLIVQSGFIITIVICIIQAFSCLLNCVKIQTRLTRTTISQKYELLIMAFLNVAVIFICI